MLAFGRPQSPRATAAFRLRALAAGGRYRLEDADSGECREVTSQVLTDSGLSVELPEPRSCCLLFCRRSDNA